jgi:hypothetical protein
MRLYLECSVAWIWLVGEQNYAPTVAARNAHQHAPTVHVEREVRRAGILCIVSMTHADHRFYGLLVVIVHVSPIRSPRIIADLVLKVKPQNKIILGLGAAEPIKRSL